jgi:hypothetical protein
VKRILAAFAVVVLLAGLGTAALVWRLTKDHPPELPEISAYSHGNMTRVGPFRYCQVLNLNDCQVPGTQGELPVNPRNPVQLSVPTSIGRAPWVLLRYYEDSDAPVVTNFPAHTKLAVTIPTVDPQHGRLQGFGVYLVTLVLNEVKEVALVPHAEWFVRTPQV